MIGDVITWQSLLTLFAVAAPVAGVWYRLNNRIEQGSKDLAEFKLEVARSYATNETIREVVQAIERLGTRIDRILEQRPHN